MTHSKNHVADSVANPSASVPQQAGGNGVVSTTALKPGTIIEFYGTPAFADWPGVAPERARIVKPRARNLPLPGPGWHIVRFNDGGGLCVHQSSFRVIDNRA